MICGHAPGAAPNFNGGQQVGLFAGALVSGGFVGVSMAQFDRNWRVDLALR